MNKAIFLINSLSSGGAERVLSVIVEKLVKEKCDVRIIFLEKKEFYKLPKEVKKIHLSNFTGKENALIKFLFLPIFAWKLKKYIKLNNIKLVQSHIFRSNYVNILSKLLGSNHEVQIVITSILSAHKKRGLLGKINYFLIKTLFSKADLIIWKSKRMQYDANNLFNFNTNQVVINNPLNVEKIQKLSTEKIDDFKFDKNKVYLINVARMESFKKQEWIIKTLPFLNNKIELILIGDGKNKQNLKNIANELRVIKRVHFLGKKSNPYKYVAKSDIFILSSDNGEGFPNALVEALACKTPAISSDCVAGPREILHPNSDITKQLKKGDGFEIGEYGMLFAIWDIKSLKDAINYLLENKKLYYEYQSKSIKRAKDFSIENIIKNYKNILNLR